MRFHVPIQLVLVESFKITNFTADRAVVAMALLQMSFQTIYHSVSHSTELTNVITAF
jgi:hypothetical protein